MQVKDLPMQDVIETAVAPKIEVHRPSLGKPPIWPGQTDIVAIAADAPVSADRMVLALNDPVAIATWIVAG